MPPQYDAAVPSPSRNENNGILVGIRRRKACPETKSEPVQGNRNQKVKTILFILILRVHVQLRQVP